MSRGRMMKPVWFIRCKNGREFTSYQRLVRDIQLPKDAGEIESIEPFNAKHEVNPYNNFIDYRKAPGS